MLNWICPGCGRECPPATRECPSCTDLAQAPEGKSVAALAVAVSSRSASVDAGSADAGNTATAVMEPPAQVPAAEATPEPPAEPEPRSVIDQDLKHVRTLLIERIAGGQQRYALDFLRAQIPIPAGCVPESEPLQQPLVASLLLTQRKVACATLQLQAEEQWDARLAEAAAAQLTTVIDILEGAQRVHAEEAWRARADEEARRQRTLRIRELEGSLSGTGAEPVPEPVRQPVQAAVLPRETAWEREVARQREATALAVAEDAALAIRVYARETLDAQVEAAARQVHERALAAIVDTFKTQPESALLPAPVEVILVPARIAGHQRIGLELLAPIAPGASGRQPGANDFSTRLPVSVKHASSLQRERNVLPVETKRLYPLVLSGLAVISTILLIGSFFGTSNQQADAKTPPDTSAVTDTKPSPSRSEAVTRVSVPATPITQFAKDVEVSGLRIGVDLLHRSQLQYLVINHSGIQLSGLVLNIKVTSIAPGSKGVLFQVSAVVPSLGPNESKEIRTDIEGQLQSKPIPDWQYLKTDVQVTNQ